MDKVKIGLDAGVLWHLLADNKLWRLPELREASGLDVPDFFAALGWLAREDKIDFGSDGADGQPTVNLMMNIYY